MADVETTPDFRSIHAASAESHATLATSSSIEMLSAKSRDIFNRRVASFIWQEKGS